MVSGSSASISHRCTGPKKSVASSGLLLGARGGGRRSLDFESASTTFCTVLHKLAIYRIDNFYINNLPDIPATRHPLHLPALR